MTAPEPTRRLVVEVPAATAEALDRMAAALGCSPEEAAERILTAAASIGVDSATKAANTRTWRQPRRRDR